MRSNRMMKNRLCCISLFLLVMLAGCASTMQTNNFTVKEGAAELVFKNGYIYTPDSQAVEEQAVAIKDGYIVFVGESNDASKYIGSDTKVIDLGNKMLLPAFADGHMHPARSAYIYGYQVYLANMTTHEGYLEVIKTYSDRFPDHFGIQGAGYSRSTYDKIGPRKEDLDAIDDTRPIAITSADGHSMWVNSKALEMAGIKKGTPQPKGGVIQFDPITGEPAGLLQEYGAMSKVEAIFPEHPKDDIKKSLLGLQEWLNSKGIVMAHDAWVDLDAQNYLDAYRELDQEGLLTVRYRGSWYLTPENCFEKIEKGIALSKQFKTENFQVKSFKFFTDQVLEEETAGLLEPYAHRPDYYGQMDWENETLQKAYEKVDKAGFQIHTHAIGDAAVKQAVDAIGHTQLINGKRDARHSLAHVQIARPEEIEKMGQLGMSAHLSPYWMVIDDYFWDLYLPYLGEERAYNRQYPHKSLFEAGVNVTHASDFGVTEPDVPWAIYSGMTRRLPQRVYDLWYGKDPAYKYITDPSAKLEKNQMGTLPPLEEMVDLEQMLDALTINVAKANFLDEKTGSIEVGKLADLTVLDKNLFKIKTEDIPSVNVLMTLFEGKIVFKDDSF